MVKNPQKAGRSQHIRVHGLRCVFMGHATLRAFRQFPALKDCVDNADPTGCIFTESKVTVDVPVIKWQ